MKKFTRNIVMMAVSMIFATLTMAADSGGNSVYIDQTNADNSSVSITQTGSDNSVGDRNSLLTPAFKIDGNAMFLTIIQTGMNNAIIGNFIGGDSTANITQLGNVNSLEMNQGNFGTSSGLLNLTYTGDNNTHNLNMGTTANAGNYNFSLTATGSSNIITNTINSKYTVNDVTITGNSNTLTTTQVGANGTSNVTGHYFKSSIIGSNNTASITQDGTTRPNQVTLNVTGSGTSTTIVQH
jgi:hypothetical protein